MEKLLENFPLLSFFGDRKHCAEAAEFFVRFWGGGGGWVVHCEEVDMATIALPRVQCFLLLPRTSGVSSHFGIRASLGSPLRCGRIPDGFCGAPVNSALAVVRGSHKRPSCFTAVVRSLQQNLEAVPVSAAEYQTFVEEVKSQLESEHEDLPVGRNGRDDNDLILWFLRDRKFLVQATVSKLAKALEWRRDFGVDKITDVSIHRMAATGKAYLHTSPDVEGRPVVIVVAAKHFPVEEELVESEQLCIYLIEKALSQLPPGGDKMLGIFDLRGFKSRNGDLKFMKFLIDVFFNYYPKRMGQVLFVDAPYIFQPGWNMVRPWLKSYANLVRFCSVAEVREQYFTPATVPIDFM